MGYEGRNREQYNAYGRAWYQRNREAERERARRRPRRRRTPEQAEASRVRQRAQRRRLTPEQVEARRERERARSRRRAPEQVEAARVRERAWRVRQRGVNRLLGLSSHPKPPNNTLRRRAARLVQRARRRAKETGIPFDVTIADLMPLSDVCPVLGGSFQCGKEGTLDWRPSLDRMDPKKGYVKGNVRVISFRANTLKSNATADEIRCVLAYLEQIELLA